MDELDGRLQELLEKALTQSDPGPRNELNRLLRENADARRCIARLLVDEQVLLSRLREESLAAILTPGSVGAMSLLPNPAKAKHRAPSALWRPSLAAAAGLVLGLFSASMVFGSGLLRPAALKVHRIELANPGFEEALGRLPSGFPVRTGAWSGDESEVVEANAPGAAALQSGRALRFVHAAADRPAGLAYACDVYQLVDLRPAQALSRGAPSTLDFSAAFHDGRPAGSTLAKISCRIYVFSGDPASLAKRWPDAQEAALTTALGRWESSGGNSEWRRVETQTVLPASAEFAVIHLAAWDSSQEGRPPAFGQIFADDIHLSLLSQTPQTLPVPKR